MEYAEYRKKVDGCFTGKAVGGTLGMPFEGKLETRVLTGYDPEPTEMLSNDDLDLQVVNLEIVRKYGLPVNRHHLSGLWDSIQDAGPDEYGAAHWNVLLGRYAPLSGYYCNKFHGGMGAAIRSELWACLAPGNPALAVRLAREDACTDHYDDGVDACVFLTAVESAAFTEHDMGRLIDTGLSFLRPEGRLAQGLRYSMQCWDKTHDPYAARELYLEKFRVQNWTDVTINLGFILISWLASGGDFSRGICAAGGLGYDADCTCATLGSIMGIIDPDSIGERWTRPLGDALVLSSSIMGLHEPDTIGELCDRIAATAHEVTRFYGSPVGLEHVPEGIRALKMHAPWTDDPDAVEPAACPHESLIGVTPLVTTLTYPERVALRPGKAGAFSLTLKGTASGRFTLAVPEGWRVTPDTFEFSLPRDEHKAFRFEVTAAAMDKHRSSTNALQVDFEAEDGLRWSLQADMPVSIPWLRKNLDTGEETAIEADEVFQTVPAGHWLYRTALKTNRVMPVRFGAFSNRAIRARLNGEEVIQADGSFYVPAYHRGRMPKKDLMTCNINGGWNYVEIEVADGPEGELFFGLARQHNCCEWIRGVEYSLRPLR